MLISNKLKVINDTNRPDFFKGVTFSETELNEMLVKGKVNFKDPITPYETIKKGIKLKKGKDYFIKENRLYIKKSSIVKIKDITGGRVGKIFKKDRFSTEFSLFAELFGLGVPFLNSYYTNPGTYNEDIITKGLEQVLKGKIEGSIEVKDPEEVKYNEFQGVYKHLGGLTDGIITWKNGKKVLLEVKTTNGEKWNYWDKGMYAKIDGYKNQCELYCFLSNINKYIILGVGVDKKHYEGEMIEMNKLDKFSLTIFDFDRAEYIKEKLPKIQKFINKYIKSNDESEYYISPLITNANIDKDIVEFLNIENENNLKKWFNKVNKINK